MLLRVVSIVATKDNEEEDLQVPVAHNHRKIVNTPWEIPISLVWFQIWKHQT